VDEGGVLKKINLVKLFWWAREHVRVTCGSIPSILTGFWHQGVTVWGVK
jgi:hypothetical protein